MLKLFWKVPIRVDVTMALFYFDVESDRASCSAIFLCSTRNMPTLKEEIRMTPSTPLLSITPISIENGLRPRGRIWNPVQGRIIPNGLWSIPRVLPLSLISVYTAMGIPAWIYVPARSGLERWTTLCIIMPLVCVLGIAQHDP